MKILSSMLLALALVTPAAAQTSDGVWRCTLIGNIPLGILSIEGGNYQFQTTNTAWEPAPNGSDGSGTLSQEGQYLVPLNGPLLDHFTVTGAFGADFINFNNDKGNLFTCVPY